MVINPKILTEYGPKVLDWLKLAGKSVDNFVKEVGKLFPNLTSNVEEVIVDETLTRNAFLDVIRQNAVAGANGMAVIYKNDSDLDVFYLASVKDRDLIEEDKNKFVVVKVTDGVKKEVKEMFASALETEFGKLVIIR